MKSSRNASIGGMLARMQYDLVAKGLVSDGAGNILLLKRSNSDSRRPNQWDLPGGHVDEGEEPSQAVIREIKEESGLDATLQHLLYAKTELVKWEENDSKEVASNVTWQYFSCVANQKEVTLSHEHSDYCWVSLTEAMRIVEYHRHQEVLKHVVDNQLEI